MGEVRRIEVEPRGRVGTLKFAFELTDAAVPGVGERVGACETCEALVGESGLHGHAAYHARQVAVARDAQYAAAVTRPIG